MANERKVQAGKLETSVGPGAGVDQSLLEQRLIIHVLGDNFNKPASYIFWARNSKWVYVGLYLSEAGEIVPRNSLIRMLGRVHVLNLYENVSTEFESFLLENSKDKYKNPRPRSEIVLRYGRVRGDYKEHVTDITSKMVLTLINFRPERLQ